MNKILFIALFLVAGAFGAAAQQNILAEGPECPIEDPLVREGPFPINVTVDPFAAVKEGSEVSNIIIEGLSGLRYKINLNLILLTVKFEVDIPQVSGNATYNAQGYLDASPLRHETVPSGNFTGSGLGKGSASGVHVKGSASALLTITGHVQVTRMALDDVSFNSLAVDLGDNFRIGGEPIDWDEYSRNIKKNFDADWRQHKTALVTKIRQAANTFLKQYTLKELLELIGDLIGSKAEC